MISQQGMAGWGKQVHSSVDTYQQLLWGRSRLKFLPLAPNKIPAGLPSHCICLLGEKRGPEFNYLLFLVQLWVITVEPGGPLAMYGDVIPASRRRRDGLNKL